MARLRLQKIEKIYPDQGVARLFCDHTVRLRPEWIQKHRETGWMPRGKFQCKECPPCVVSAQEELELTRRRLRMAIGLVKEMVSQIQNPMAAGPFIQIIEMFQVVLDNPIARQKSDVNPLSFTTRMDNIRNLARAHEHQKAADEIAVALQEANALGATEPVILEMQKTREAHAAAAKVGCGRPDCKIVIPDIPTVKN